MLDCTSTRFAVHVHSVLFVPGGTSPMSSHHMLPSGLCIHFVMISRISSSARLTTCTPCCRRKSSPPTKLSFSAMITKPNLYSTHVAEHLYLSRALPLLHRPALRVTHMIHGDSVVNMAHSASKPSLTRPRDSSAFISPWWIFELSCTRLLCPTASTLLVGICTMAALPSTTDHEFERFR